MSLSFFKVGQTLFVDLSTLIGNKSRCIFSPWADHELPTDSYMAITVKEMGKSNVSFVLKGFFEHNIVRVPFLWTATKSAIKDKKHLRGRFLNFDEPRKQQLALALFSNEYNITRKG